MFGRSLADVVARIMARCAPPNAKGCQLLPGRSRKPQAKYRGKNVACARLVLRHKLGRPLKRHALHTCDVSRCMTPGHLYQGSHRRNMRDKAERNWSIKGTGRPAAKLNDHKVRYIRRHPEIPANVLAARYRVHTVQIQAVRRGASWSHVV